MRKLLLATVAALGASMGVSAVADAQTASPAPGTVTVRLNGRFRFYGAVVNDRDADNRTAGAVQNTNTAGLTTTVPISGSNKQSNYGFGNYARLYPGFDGVASNGLKYGASLEIRSDGGGGAGGGIYGSVSSNSNRRGGLYLRREWGYIGTDQLGTIRLGTTDGPSSLFATGTFENFNDGGLNGDAPAFLTGNTGITWPFATQGATYATTKAVYLSPQLYGFDIGVAYEPNTGGSSLTSGCGTGNVTTLGGANPTSSILNNTPTSGPGCDRLSSTSVAGELARRRNLVDVAIRYRGTFGGFGIAATAGYIGSGVVRDNTSPAPATARRDGLSIGDFGIAATYAGLSVGGHYQFGRYAGAYVPIPTDVDDAHAWMVGASYTIGPFVAGAHYVDYQSAGDFAAARRGSQRREHGVAAGATYSLAPGLSLFASYIWIERKQNDQNFFGTNSTRTTASVAMLGTGFSW